MFHVGCFGASYLQGLKLGAVGPYLMPLHLFGGLQVPASLSPELTCCAPGRPSISVSSLTSCGIFFSVCLLLLYDVECALLVYVARLFLVLLVVLILFVKALFILQAFFLAVLLLVLLVKALFLVQAFILVVLLLFWALALVLFVHHFFLALYVLQVSLFWFLIFLIHAPLLLFALFIVLRFSQVFSLFIVVRFLQVLSPFVCFPSWCRSICSTASSPAFRHLLVPLVTARGGDLCGGLPPVPLVARILVLFALHVFALFPVFLGMVVATYIVLLVRYVTIQVPGFVQTAFAVTYFV